VTSLIHRNVLKFVELLGSLSGGAEPKSNINVRRTDRKSRCAWGESQRMLLAKQVSYVMNQINHESGISPEPSSRHDDICLSLCHSDFTMSVPDFINHCGKSDES
jgi:hypothetical protein